MPDTTCTRCGHRLIRDFAGWMHAPAVPMSATERRALRHIPTPTDNPSREAQKP